MNPVSDLAARAVSFIALIQEQYRNAYNRRRPSGDPIQQMHVADVFSAGGITMIREHIEREKQEYCAGRRSANPRAEDQTPPTPFQLRVVHLVYFGTAIPEFDEAERYAILLMSRLADWISSNGAILFTRQEPGGTLPSLQNWRARIIKLLIASNEDRVLLADALEYLPLQIVLAIGGGAANVRAQRLMQVWFRNGDGENFRLFSANDRAWHRRLWQGVPSERVEALLKDNRRLLWELKHGSPLSFDLVQLEELDEVRKSRATRRDDTGRRKESVPPADDAISLAQDMQLYGLALSGGGFRAATFSLGVLQGLARQNLLKHFDYLSTVSGGGYTGAWLAAWIKREGDLVPVSDVLNPDNCLDPRTDEASPIRWLRIYSNSFSPKTNLADTASWTAPVAWLRNVLLKQLFLLLILLTALLGFRGIFELWRSEEIWSNSFWLRSAFLNSIMLVLITTILAGNMMRVKPGEGIAVISENRKKSLLAAFITIASLLLFSGVSAALLYHSSPDMRQHFSDIGARLSYVAPLLGWLTAGLILFSIIGQDYRIVREQGSSTLRAWLRVFFAAALAAIVATTLLSLDLAILREVRLNADRDPHSEIWTGIAFIAGTPLLVLSIAGTMSLHSILLKRNADDVRNESWRRMGAALFQASLLYVLLSVASIIWVELVALAIATQKSWWTGPVTIGGWLALLFTSAKAAVSAKNTDTGTSSARRHIRLLQVLSESGPYVMAVGLLVLLPATLRYFPTLGVALNLPGTGWQQYLLFMAFSGIAAYFLARAVGVNDLSMLHFYRARLVRLYLGASRRQSQRSRTVDPNTDFDSRDDLPLAGLLHAEGYNGPYVIFNSTLNASKTAQSGSEHRQVESFTFTPLYCGFDFSLSRESAVSEEKRYDYAYRPTSRYAYPAIGGPTIGTAMAISGISVSGRHGDKVARNIANLLTSFDAQMGWWLGNPRKSEWQSSDPDSGLAYILANMREAASTRNTFVCLSDGGHFDNMGLYELIRRRCRFIVLSDAEADGNFTCAGITAAIRRCRIDFAVEIAIDLEEITTRDEHYRSKQRFAMGEIRYPEAPDLPGVLLYLKSSLNGTEPADVTGYAMKHRTFPNQATSDYIFDEEEFESYRRLGLHIADEVFQNESVRNVLRV